MKSGHMITTLTKFEEKVREVGVQVGENGGAPPFGEHRPPKYNEK